MNSLPDSYKLEKNLGWEAFKVVEDYDDSYKRLGITDIEFESDIFITYLPGGENLTVDMDRKRRAVLKINRNGHSSYPDLQPGDGYLFTIYNEDTGTAQLGTKPVRLVTANENYLVFRGSEVLALGPFGLIDPGNTDYGVAVFLDNNRIRKISFYRYDTKKSYEYANTRNASLLPRLSLTFNEKTPTRSSLIDSEPTIDYYEVAANVDSFLEKFAVMSMSEKVRLTSETDRVFGRGSKLWYSGNKKEALRYFREALDIYPINTDVIGIYGDYYEYSDYDLSMKFYELAIRLNSIRKKDYFQLANFYKWKGQYDKAERCYARWEYIKQRAGIED